MDGRCQCDLTVAADTCMARPREVQHLACTNVTDFLVRRRGRVIPEGGRRERARRQSVGRSGTVVVATEIVGGGVTGESLAAFRSRLSSRKA